MKPTYRIKDWESHFENNRTRELSKLRFVIMPNKQDGDGYTELVEHPNGAAHLGAWCAIVQVASKCSPRGTLLREAGRPHDSGSLARQTRIRKEVFDEVLPRLTGSIGWVEELDTDGRNIEHEAQSLFGSSAEKSQVAAESCAALKERREEDLIQEDLTKPKQKKERDGLRAEARSPSKPKLCDGDYLNELQKDEAYKLLNVRLVHAKMVRWCKEKGKVATRMRLIGWLNREDVPMNGNGNGSYQKHRSEPETAQGNNFKFVPKSVIR